MCKQGMVKCDICGERRKVATGRLGSVHAVTLTGHVELLIGTKPRSCQVCREKLVKAILAAVEDIANESS